MLEALNAACIIAPIAAIAFLVIDLVRRGASQVLLCMECEQCAGACPLALKAERDFLGPRGIMAAAKVGDPSAAIERGALLCNGCKACERVCPRGLAPYLEVTRWKASTISTGKVGERKRPAGKGFRAGT
jgi:succinate dehydrogenase/fumarate reductase-like Fe-S protein